MGDGGKFWWGKELLLKWVFLFDGYVYGGMVFYWVCEFLFGLFLGGVDELGVDE